MIRMPTIEIARPRPFYRQRSKAVAEPTHQDEAERAFSNKRRERTAEKLRNDAYTRLMREPRSFL